MINFCDLETKVEFWLVTNLPADGEAAVTDEDIRDIYCCRWGVELLWKFLKMHLKLDKLITKNANIFVAEPILTSPVSESISNFQLFFIPKTKYLPAWSNSSIKFNSANPLSITPTASYGNLDIIKELSVIVGLVTRYVQLFQSTVRNNLTFFNQHISDEGIH